MFIVIINIAFCFIHGEVAQLARATGSYPVGREFESPSRYQKTKKAYSDLLEYAFFNLEHIYHFQLFSSFIPCISITYFIIFFAFYFIL